MVSPLWLQGPSPLYLGPFRSNVREFLVTYGSQVQVAGPGLDSTNFWVLPLKHGKETVNLHVYEETHADNSEGAHICDECRNMGKLAGQVHSTQPLHACAVRPNAWCVHLLLHSAPFALGCFPW